MRINISKLVFSVLVCEVAGIVGSIFTVSAIPTWYSNLIKPSFNPPNWVFGPVWTTLYFLMGIALYLVWIKDLKRKENKQATVVFAAQLVLNVLWSIVFFGGHSISGAFAVIVMLWVLILGTLLLFFRISKVAGLLLIPYLVWVSFASVLNFYLLKLN